MAWLRFARGFALGTIAFGTIGAVVLLAAGSNAGWALAAPALVSAVVLPFIEREIRR